MTTEKSASDDAVLDDVFSSGRDRGGNSAPPEDVSSPEATGSQEPIEAESHQPSQEATDPSTGKVVPLNELLSERKKFQEKLDTLRAEGERRDAEYRRQLEDIARRTQQAQPQPQPAPKIPDPLQDPEQYFTLLNGTVQNSVFVERLNLSEDRARDKYGDKEVDEAFQAAERAGLIQRSHFIQTSPRHPWGAMVDWYRQQKVLETVGADPDAYRAKIEEEVRAKVLEELKAGKGPGEQQQQPTRFPGTLADSTAAGKQGAHLTTRAVMADVFGSDRASRRRS